MQAFNRSPRHHGECIAIIRIWSVTHEPDSEAPDSDYEAEGFAWLHDHPEALPKTNRLAYQGRIILPAFWAWREAGGSSWVCRFSVVELTDAGRELAARFDDERSIA